MMKTVGGVRFSELLDQHVAVLGKTRSGKSSVMRLLVENLLDRDERVCVIDPKGDWWGLKSSADGKRPGYGVIIFGGKKADVPINEYSGSTVAELVATGNRPCIIDLGGWFVGQRTRFYIDFASTLFHHLDSPLRLVIDEVHNFAPQGKVLDPDAGKMLHWSNRLASEGAGKGLVILSASQRPQKVHKDFLTCAETLIAMRVIHKLDRMAVKDWLDGAGDEKLGKQVLDTLAGNARGQGWVWSPENKIGPVQVQFPMFGTYDSFAAPTGTKRAKLKGWASVDLAEVTSKLAKVVEEAKANDPKELKSQIAKLRSDLVRAAAKTAPAVDQKQFAAALSRAVSENNEAWKRAIKALVPMIRDAQLKIRRTFDDALQALANRIGSVQSPTMPRLKSTFAPVKANESAKAEAGKRGEWSHGVQHFDGDGDALSKGERTILAAIVQFNGCTDEQITVLTGYKKTSKYEYLRQLKAKNLIFWDGDTALATTQGKESLGSFEPLPTGGALREYWLHKLTGGEHKLLAAVCAAYPGTLTGEALQDVCGYKKTSVYEYLRKLKARKLVESVGGDEVRASESLFD